MHPIFERLKERKVVQWALAYLAGAVALYSALDAFAEPWGVGDFQLRIAQVGLLVGFFVAITLAWYHGERGEQRVTGAELLILAGIMGLGAIGVRMVTVGLPPPPTDPVSSVSRFDITPGATAAVSEISPGIPIALSPDARTIVFVGPGPEGTQLWQRPLDELTATPIPGTEGADNPVFSPDGRSLAFTAGSGLRTVSLLGGPFSTIVEGGALGSVYIDWGPDDMLYFAANTSGGRGLHRVAGVGGEPEELVPLPDGVNRVVLPEVLPEGRAVLVTLRRDAPEDATVAVVIPQTGEVRELVGGSSARYVDGHILYATWDHTLMAARFDLGSLRMSGEPAPVLQGVNVRLPGLGAQFAVSDNGTLLYRTHSDDPVELVWVDRIGTITQVDPDLTFPAHDASSLALSPDGERIAVTLPGEPGLFDIWIKELDSGRRSRISFDGGVNRRPAWAGGGEFVTWVRTGLPGVVRRARADGSGSAETVLSIDRNLPEGFFSPDGQWLVFRAGSPSNTSNPDVYGLRVGVDTVGHPMAAGPHREMVPSLSPNGRWLAYASDETGSAEVYVRPFPNASEAKYQVSSDGGWNPVWSRDGRELFYPRFPPDGRQQFVAVEIREGATFSTGSERILFEDPELYLSNRSFDVSPEGERFIMLRKASRPAEDGRVILVQSFLRELERLLPN